MWNLSIPIATPEENQQYFVFQTIKTPIKEYPVQQFTVKLTLKQKNNTPQQKEEKLFGNCVFYLKIDLSDI